MAGKPKKDIASVTLTMEHADGERISLCRCFKSKTMPYCDGAHKQLDTTAGPVRVRLSPELVEALKK